MKCKKNVNILDKWLFQCFNETKKRKNTVQSTGISVELWLLIEELADLMSSRLDPKRAAVMT